MPVHNDPKMPRISAGGEEPQSKKEVSSARQVISNWGKKIGRAKDQLTHRIQTSFWKTQWGKDQEVVNYLRDRVQRLKAAVPYQSVSFGADRGAVNFEKGTSAIRKALMDVKASCQQLENRTDFKQVKEEAYALNDELENALQQLTTLNTAWYSRPLDSLIVRLGRLKESEDLQPLKEDVEQLSQQCAQKKKEGENVDDLEQKLARLSAAISWKEKELKPNRQEQEGKAQLNQLRNSLRFVLRKFSENKDLKNLKTNANVKNFLKKGFQADNSDRDAIEKETLTFITILEESLIKSEKAIRLEDKGRNIKFIGDTRDLYKIYKQVADAYNAFQVKPEELTKTVNANVRKERGSTMEKLTSALNGMVDAANAAWQMMRGKNIIEKADVEKSIQNPLEFFKSFEQLLVDEELAGKEGSRNVYVYHRPEQLELVEQYAKARDAYEKILKLDQEISNDS